MAGQLSGRVTVEYDVVFGHANGRDLKCNVYHPPQPGPGRPAVLLVHGGGWMTGDRSQLHGYGILLGRIGYVCVATEYRLAGESKWPAQIQDVKACLRWMRANADRLAIDPKKIIVEGNSAGAHLSLMIAGTPDEPEFEGDGGNPGVPTDVAACVAIYGPAILYAQDDPRMPQQLEFLFGRGAPDGVARRASPVEWITPDFPPTLLVTGNRDELVPAQSSFLMYQRLLEAGAPVELHVYADAPHAFDATPEFGRQVAAIMTLFLDRYVTNPRQFNTIASQQIRQDVQAAASN
jgi:acetyl esterase/lipase